jgi:hypothetical protein
MFIWRLLCLVAVASDDVTKGAFGEKEGVGRALADDAGPDDEAAGKRVRDNMAAMRARLVNSHYRTHAITNETNRLGLHIHAPERATQFPVIMSCMLDYLQSAVFIFNDLFGVSDFEDSACTPTSEATFQCQFAEQFVPAKVIHSEYVTLVKCKVPSQLRQERSLRVSLTRTGGLSFQPQASWPDLLLSKTPLPESSTLVGCVSFNAGYNGLPMLGAWLAFHQLMGFDHVLLYDTGKGDCPSTEQRRSEPDGGSHHLSLYVC